MNTQFLTEITAAADAGQYGRLNDILDRYQATRTIIKDFGNGLARMEYKDSTGGID